MLLDSVLQEAIVRIKSICDASQGRSQYYPHGGSGYKASVTHYFTSSTQVAACAVEPGSENDLAEIVRVIADTHVPFAVKCGGHTSNPGFSSTTGIQISLSRLNRISVNVHDKLVRAGAGCLFGELYQELDRYKLNIVGGSGLAGVGLSGWMLGGGYSVKTSLHGLGIDNLEAVRVILPNGTIKVANDNENEDLFFAIKGGGNNYGIVTEFTLRAHAQPDETFHQYLFTYREDHFDQVKRAIYNIIRRGDKKANVEAAFRHYSQPGTQDHLVVMTVDCVYDGVYPSDDPFAELKRISPDNIEPAGSSAFYGNYKTDSFVFADLLRSLHNGTCDFPTLAQSITGSELAVISNLNTLQVQSSQEPMRGIGQFPRGRWGNVMVDEFTVGIINGIQEHAREVAEKLRDREHGGTRITIAMWPFTKEMFDKATRSAFPHERGKPNCPIIVYFTWEEEKNDDFWVGTMKSTLETLRGLVRRERPGSEVENLPHFINTALFEDTEPKNLYRDNLPELERLRKKYDLHHVMDCTGGFRISHEETDEEE